MEQPTHVSSRNSVRAQHRDLPHLATNQEKYSLSGWGNLASGVPKSEAGETPHSEMDLVSPTVAAVHQYYLDIRHGRGLKAVPALRQSQEFPRRHSSLSPSCLTSQMREVRISSPTGSSASTGIDAASHPIASGSREMPLYISNCSELARLSRVVSKRGSLQRGRPPHTMGKIPTEYTKCRLQEWGPVYLGNMATADAFVRAIPLQKSRRGLVSEGGRPSEKPLPPVGLSRMKITVRARVFPKAKEREPFLIQRHFDLQAMQANSLGASANDSKTRNKEVNDMGTSSSADVRIRAARSKSIYSVGTSGRLEEREPRRDISAGFHSIEAERQTMPIHVEYAFHYLPVLAALMLSGHIRKGDAIDLPLPRPEAWRESVSHIYTGKGDVTTAMKENIIYLAGRVS